MFNSSGVKNPTKIYSQCLLPLIEIYFLICRHRETSEFEQSVLTLVSPWCDLMKALSNLFVESAVNDKATYSEWNNMSLVNRTATSEQSWRRKEPMPCCKQSTQAKQLTVRNKNALTRMTLQENKITPNRTFSPSTWKSTHTIVHLRMQLDTSKSTSC